MLQELVEESIRGPNPDDMHSMQQKIEEIKNVWNPVFPTPTYDAESSSYQLAHRANFFGTNVNFQLFGIVTRRNQFTFYLIKTPCDAADTTLNVTIDGIAMKSIKIENWTNNRISEDVVIPDSFVDLYGKSIEFKITWKGFLNTPYIPLSELVQRIKPEKVVPSRRSISLHDHMAHFLETPDLSDMEIIVQDEKIPVHKFILASQSVVFMAMFQSGLSESTNNRIEIKDVDSDIMKKVVEFLYTGKIKAANLTIDEIIAILDVAEKYNIIELKNSCESVFLTRVTKDNALKLFELANLYRLENLIEIAIIWMIDNKLDISKSDYFKDLYNRKPDIFFKFLTRIMGT